MNEGDKAPEVGPDEATKPTVEPAQPEEQGSITSEPSVAEMPEENTLQPTAPEPNANPISQSPAVTKEIERQVIVKQASEKSPKPKTVEKVAERIVEKPAPAPIVSPEQKPRSSKLAWFLVGLLTLIILAGAGAAWWYVNHHNKTDQTASKAAANDTTSKAPSKKAQGLQLDTAKNYGNKYADGILPVGDGKYSTATAKKGYVYACSTYVQNLTNSAGGAMTRGPWFIDNNTMYDSTKKVHVLGSVTWQPQFSNTVSGSTRTITTNDLPNHATGVFPIASTDPAYSYDHNPNSITSQSLTYALTTNPTYNNNPNCMGGQSGVMLTGVALFNAFDAGGRDAGAWEVQDNCGGHPEKEGEYHYHTLSGCVKDISVHTVIGYALDGFPITGPQVGTNNVLTTNDLDECHGITSAYFVDGKSVTGYHYVMTQDFPYSVSCFRGTAITPPGQQGAAATPSKQ